MRLLRKVQYLSSPSKLGRIFIAICASTFCVMGIKSFVSLEDITARTKSALSTPAADGGVTNETILLNDAPVSSFNKLRKEGYLSRGGKKRNGSISTITTTETSTSALVTEETDYPGLREDRPEWRMLTHSPLAKPDLQALATTEALLYDSSFIQNAVPLPPSNTPVQLLTLSHQPENFAVGPGVNNWPPPPPPPPAFGIQPLLPGQMPTQSVLPTEPINQIIIEEKIVHFDLKGAPPKISYYKEIFPVLKKMGATGLLMEYEDMFPYSGRLKVVNAKNAYSKTDIAEIRRLAALNGLSIIPLVQTFGHLEFVLKHESFRSFREVDQFPQAVCPTRNGTFELVVEMVAQNLALHPNITYLHIGADEVFHLGMCPICSSLQANPGKTGSVAQQLFLAYVAQLLTALRSRFPHIIPIMWDDMFHTMGVETIKTGLGDLVKYVEPMIWSYFQDWGHHLPLNGDLYAELFPNVWGATAFKGSDGETRQVPNVKLQAQIHTSWIEALVNNGYKFKNFRGIALTGWSRYDHFYLLCELFPVSIPSLAINLAILNDSALTLNGVQRAAKILNCQMAPANLDFLTYDPLLEQFSNCEFPGIDVFRSVHSVAMITKQVKEFLDELEIKFPEYQIRNNFVQPSRIDEFMGKLGNYDVALFGYSVQAQPAFLKVYDEYTLNEWVSANVESLLKKVHAWQRVFEKSRNQRTWPARPFNVSAVNVTFQQPVATIRPTPNLPVFQGRGRQPIPAPLVARQNPLRTVVTNRQPDSQVLFF